MKSNPIIEVLETIDREIFGGSKKPCSADAQCIMCGREVLGFNNELEAKTFEVFGLCSDCQSNTLDGGVK